MFSNDLEILTISEATTGDFIMLHFDGNVMLHISWHHSKRRISRGDRACANITNKQILQQHSNYWMGSRKPKIALDSTLCREGEQKSTDSPIFIKLITDTKGGHSHANNGKHMITYDSRNLNYIYGFQDTQDHAHRTRSKGLKISVLTMMTCPN